MSDKECIRRAKLIRSVISDAKNQMRLSGGMAAGRGQQRDFRSQSVLPRCITRYDAQAEKGQQRAGLRRPDSQRRWSCSCGASRRCWTCYREQVPTIYWWTSIRTPTWPSIELVRAAGGRKAQPVRGGRRRPVDLRLARRGHPQYSGIRKGLPGRAS